MEVGDPRGEEAGGGGSHLRSIMTEPEDLIVISDLEIIQRLQKSESAVGVEAI